MALGFPGYDLNARDSTSSLRLPCGPAGLGATLPPFPEVPGHYRLKAESIYHPALGKRVFAEPHNGGQSNLGS